MAERFPHDSRELQQKNENQRCEEEGSSERRVCRVLASVMTKGFLTIPNDELDEDAAELLESIPHRYPWLAEQGEEERLSTALLNLRFPHLVPLGGEGDARGEEKSQISDSEESEVLAASQPEHLSPEESIFILDHGSHQHEDKWMDKIEPDLIEAADGKKNKRKKKAPKSPETKRFKKAMEQILSDVQESPRSKGRKLFLEAMEQILSAVS